MAARALPRAVWRVRLRQRVVYMRRLGRRDELGGFSDEGFGWGWGVDERNAQGRTAAGAARQRREIRELADGLESRAVHALHLHVERRVELRGSRPRVDVALPCLLVLTDMLHTNAVPSDVVCESIRHFLQGPQKELAYLTEEILRLESLLEEASNKRDCLKQFIDAHLALVSPVRRLPDDIVGTIFVAALPSTRNPAISSDEAPLLLCQICRSWRIIALATPRLWARIHVVVQTQSRIQNLTDMVTSWLARSGTVPLEFSIFFSRTFESTCDPSLLVATLVGLSPRWKDIQFDLAKNSSLSFIAPVASLSSEDVPLLQTFTINVPMQSAGRGTTAPFTILRAKSLRSVTLPGTGNWALQNPGLWGHLQDLTISAYRDGDFTYSTALAVLAQCTILETCNLTLAGVGTFTPSQHHISLPHLSHLTINNWLLPLDGPHFFNYISLPNLSSFECQSYLSEHRAVMPLESLFPSSITLTRLRVSVAHLSSSVLLAVFATLGSLEVLHILGEPYRAVHEEDPDFLTHLTSAPDTLDPVLCPRLRDLELHEFKGVSDETLLAFVRARAALSLVRISVMLRRSMQRDIMPDLRDVIADGLDIRLSYMATREIVYSPLEGTEGYRPRRRRVNHA
ncbi:hypothetical protein DFH09DRAFT_1277033 [Mycena vulgaris]|nr:hypothetical protein DFH09DRAFT_1277033 [Mycena vulgaris]